MRVLGIESSCDETAAAVVDEFGVVYSDVVQTQVDLHAQYGGVIPELASRDHLRNASFVVRRALDDAGLSLSAIDAIAVTNRPGLVGALLVGVQLAKGMAWASGKPVLGVDHLVGHLLAVFLTRPASANPESEAQATEPASGPSFPYVCLLASGGHTALYRVDGPTPDRIEELGSTRDDAAGEAFDKVGKILGLPYPGGPRIDRLSKNGNALALPLTRPMLRAKGKGKNDGAPHAEFSFSGIKTQVAQYVERHGRPATDAALADVCASFQAAVTSVLADKLLAAATREGVQHVVIGGGVAANSELRKRVADGARATGISAWLPSLASCTDNAAMIAYAGVQQLLASRSTSGLARSDMANAPGAHDVGAFVASDLALLATSTSVLVKRTRKGRGER